MPCIINNYVSCVQLLSHSEEPRDSVALTSDDRVEYIMEGSDKDNAFFLDNEGDDGANMLEVKKPLGLLHNNH